MPYVTQRARKDLDGPLRELANRIYSGGDLNYCVTMLALTLMHRKGGNYAAMSGVIGDLECCKQELYRKRLSPYEDAKEKVNGS